MGFHDVNRHVPQYILSYITAPPSLQLDLTNTSIHEALDIFPDDLDFDEHLPNLCQIRTLSVSCQVDRYLGPEEFSITGTGASSREILFTFNLLEPSNRISLDEHFIVAINDFAQHPSGLILEAFHFTNLNHVLSDGLFSKVMSNFPFVTALSFTSCVILFDDITVSLASSLCPVLQFLRLENMSIDKSIV